MTRNSPLTQVDVESEILRLMDALEEHTVEYEELIEACVEAEVGFKQAWNKDFLNQKGHGTQKDREAWADYTNSGLQHAWKIAEGRVKAKQQKLSSIRTALDSLRTLSANVRNMT